MELTATAKAILGILAMRPRSGYEIKRFVDDSTRFFWAASYGQIYPELKRLSEHGLIDGTDSPRRGRQRTVYKITQAGRRALRDSHNGPPEVYELRDEGLLKLFLAGPIDPGRAPEIARQRGEHSERIAARLREVEAAAERKDMPSYAVLRFGIELNDFVADYWERVATELEELDEGEQLARPESTTAPVGTTVRNG